MRWTQEQRERATAIVNDIAEGIDNGESRAELRRALAIYADFLCEAHQSSQERHDELMDSIMRLHALLNTKSKL